jgi:hypothetical protein
MTTEPTTTPWADRIHARVEARQAVGAQTEILPGYVVCVYDRGAKDPDAPVHHSEHAHGDLGVFGSEAEAEAYRDRIKPATIAAREQEGHEREVRAPRSVDLGVAEQAKRDAAKAKASAANAEAKAHQKAIDQLQQEAKAPEILVECSPRGSGWRVMAAPALIDGTLGGAPRLLQRAPKAMRREPLGTSGVLDQALADTEARTPKGNRKRPPPRTTKAADHPPPADAAGASLAIGTLVEIPGLQPPTSGRITEIGDWDAGAGAWIVVVEGEDGEILRPLATECMRLEPEQDGDQWPDEAA